MKIVLAVGGLFLGFGLVGLAWNNHLGQAWDILTGQTSLPSKGSKNPSPPRPKRKILPVL